MLNTKYLDLSYIKKLICNIDHQYGCKHLILDDFLDSKFYNELIIEIGNNKSTLTGDTEGRQIYYVSGLCAKKFWEFYKGPDMRKFLAYFYGENIKLECHKGGRNIFQKIVNTYRENGIFLRKNMPKSSLDWHTDGPESRIAGSFILYLNSDWRAEWGGNLELGYNTQDGIVSYQSILPIGNRCVILLCEEKVSWHRVLPVTGPNPRHFIHDQILKIIL